jgi:sugar lactone lactonase YvrE
VQVLMDGIVFGESPRWHDGRLWFSDWGAHQVFAVDLDGTRELMAAVPSFPMCIDFLPDGRLLIVDASAHRLLRREPDGTLVTHAELGGISTKPWNDIVVDVEGNAYVNNIAFDFPGGEPQPGFVARVALDGTARVVAEGLSFPNGMAITEDDGTLIVAESHANRLTAFAIGGDGELGPGRLWADAADDHPDGICLDADGAVWYADVANRHCVRIREGGERLQIVGFDRGAFACVLSRDSDNPMLFIVGQNYGGSPSTEPTGCLVAVPAPAPGAGRP